MLFPKASGSEDTRKPTSLKNCIFLTPAISHPSFSPASSPLFFLFGIPKFVTATGSRKTSSLSSHANVVTAHLLVSMLSIHSRLIASASRSNRSISSDTFLFASSTVLFDSLSNFSNRSVSTTKTSPLALTFAKGCVCLSFSASARRNSSRTSRRRLTISPLVFVALVMVSSSRWCSKRPPGGRFFSPVKPFFCIDFLFRSIVIFSVFFCQTLKR